LLFHKSACSVVPAEIPAMCELSHDSCECNDSVKNGEGETKLQIDGFPWTAIEVP
jgi:hypothetical protein